MQFVPQTNIVMSENLKTKVTKTKAAIKHNLTA
jgi:hypothetical protein